MTELRYEDITLKGADLGGVNPIPDLFDVSYIHAGFAFTDKLTPEDSRFFGKGGIQTLLPYLSQDRYNRDIKDRKYKAAILENERIRATFLPELGGRLWSLYHKELGRELLYVNDIVQPGNLALRNAWIAGGVEFNVGIKGHSPFTSSSIFAARSENDKGEPILSMYEYERIRGTVYAINAYIPNDDDKLYIRTTIENKSDGTPFTYWWSNIAVPEEGVRVLTDADEMFTCLYEDNHYLIDKVKAPIFGKLDASRPEEATHAGDVFYVTREGRKWICSPEKDGIGLLQYSTPELIGRKTFFWGQKTGGRNWVRHLCGGSRAYVEIQAGLRYTQLEHFPMNPQSTISFTECYTALKLDPEVAHGDRDNALKEVRDIVNSYPDPALADIPLDKEKEIFHLGSGFGALEDDKISSYYAFPKESMGEEQEDWLFLKENGYLPEHEFDYFPKSYKTDKKTLQMLEKSAKECKEAEHWYTYLHLGIARFANQDIDGALLAFLRSVELCDNPAARRNASALYMNCFKLAEPAIENSLRAYELAKNPDIGLLADVAKTLTSLKADEKWLEIYAELTEGQKSVARLRLYMAIALNNLGRREEAKKYLNDKFELPDVKEGELSISKVWEDIYGDVSSLPAHLNFRMFEV